MWKKSKRVNLVFNSLSFGFHDCFLTEKSDVIKQTERNKEQQEKKQKVSLMQELNTAFIRHRGNRETYKLNSKQVTRTSNDEQKLSK